MNGTFVGLDMGGPVLGEPRVTNTKLMRSALLVYYAF